MEHKEKKEETTATF